MALFTVFMVKLFFAKKILDKKLFFLSGLKDGIVNRDRDNPINRPEYAFLDYLNVSDHLTLSIRSAYIYQVGWSGAFIWSETIISSEWLPVLRANKERNKLDDDCIVHRQCFTAGWV